MYGKGIMKRTIKINAKCSDLFSANLYEDGNQVGELYDGYVPDWMPGEHYGDYVELEIDVETGKILNWERPALKDLRETFGISAPVQEGVVMKPVGNPYVVKHKK